MQPPGLSLTPSFVSMVCGLRGLLPNGAITFIVILPPGLGSLKLPFSARPQDKNLGLNYLAISSKLKSAPFCSPTALCFKEGILFTWWEFPQQMQFQTLGYILGGVELSLSSPREGLVWGSQKNIFLQLLTSLVMTAQDYSPRDISGKSPRLELALFFDLFFRLI